ncbi:MAG: AbrB/MazE/SpoVT family DNA-binding domain-containing protein [Acetobacteraceae bacterium]|nr:AbrB/MazE/SpoVT family DNA-binding domain-containing protein [Pseudomonadota bacterium]
METTRLSSKGQIILPKPVRDAHGWAPGTDFTVEDIGDGVILRPVQQKGTHKLSDLLGSLKVDGPPHTLEEMDEAITAELHARRDRRRY